MKLLDVNELAQEIRVSACTVRRLVKSGKIPHHRIGGRQFFTSDDIEIYLKNCAVPAENTRHREAAVS